MLTIDNVYLKGGQNSVYIQNNYTLTLETLYKLMILTMINTIYMTINMDYSYYGLSVQY